MISLERENLTLTEFLRFKFIKFSAQPGDKILITGRNGSGKTTFLRWLKKTITIQMGFKIVFYFDGTDYFFANLSIKENLALFNLDLDPEIIESYLTREINSLSAGEKVYLQLLALLQSPCFAILIDDCLSYLDLPRLKTLETLIWKSPKLFVVCGQYLGNLTGPWIRYGIEDGTLQPAN